MVSVTTLRRTTSRLVALLLASVVCFALQGSDIR